jgi:hypothetical protein
MYTLHFIRDNYNAQTFYGEELVLSLSLSLSLSLQYSKKSKLYVEKEDAL